MQEKDQLFSDDDVVRSVCEGNTRSFEILIDRYGKKIINFIYQMIYDHDEAQSLAQDVFVKIYESIKRYKTQDNFQAFVYTIAKNMTLNYIKKQKRILRFSGNNNGSSYSNPDERYFRGDDTQQANLERTQQDELMTGALKALNENQRLALIMKVYLDFSYKRIADITGWSEPKIETLISRAKSNLKNWIHSKEKAGENPLQEKNHIDVLKVRSA